MKRVLKYIIAVIMLGSVGIGAMTLASAGAVRLSVFNIIKLGTVEKADGGIFSEILDTLLADIKGYAYILLVLLGAVVVVAILTAALPVKAAYIVSIAGQAAINIFACIMYIQMRRWISSVQGMVEGVKGLFGLGASVDVGRIEVHYLPVVLWILLYLFTMFMAIIGLVVKEKPTVQRNAKDILPENINRGGNVYLERIQELERNRKSTGCPHAPMRQIHEAEKAITPYVPEDRSVCQKFGGALLGESGFYASKVYLMKERAPIYFCKEGPIAVLVPEQGYEKEMLAKVYYVDGYKEYCVKPMQRLSVFLESGQPLGAGREYYIPRGMRIYLINRDQMFTLA